MENIDNFIDDIIIFTLTFEQHLEVLYELLVRLKEANLTARPSKCSIGYSSQECLGHFVGDDKLKPHPDKVKAIQEAPRPVTKKQVRSFLGLVDFYRTFIPNFSCIALPLTDLTKKGQPNTVVWENAQENAFQSLRSAVVQPKQTKVDKCSLQRQVDQVYRLLQLTTYLLRQKTVIIYNTKKKLKRQEQTIRKLKIQISENDAKREVQYMKLLQSKKKQFENLSEVIEDSKMEIDDFISCEVMGLEMNILVQF
ncbi:unnamed protein product [Mytilus coruscus]|uniref:Reverse transcriptase domain-containing protein n=1 Tax=Mytilus coruscus TaxID=42192 RepID=A0A6J8ENG0_MYTCO|nr:unnamed protein product [Mytilus coruscus]